MTGKLCRCSTPWCEDGACRYCDGALPPVPEGHESWCVAITMAGRSCNCRPPSAPDLDAVLAELVALARSRGCYIANVDLRVARRGRQS